MLAHANGEPGSLAHLPCVAGTLLLGNPVAVNAELRCLVSRACVVEAVALCGPPQESRFTTQKFFLPPSVIPPFWEGLQKTAFLAGVAGRAPWYKKGEAEVELFFISVF